MKTFSYVVQDQLGIHARPAGLLVKQLKSYTSKFTITKDGKSVDMSRLMQLMGLGVKTGDEVTVSVEGADEETAAAALEAFFKENL